ncbi:MAG: helix-turn-helix transcriptional regulator [Bacteroidia bacterium]
MIQAHQQFDLLGKKIFEKAVLQPPFRIPAEMPNEACFYYIVSGCAEVITPMGTITGEANEGIVLKCGNYFNDYLNGVEGEFCEAVAVHFYPEVLKLIYDKDFPDFLLEVENAKPIKLEKIAGSQLLKSYVDGLGFYFENPALVSDELLKLKLKELILLLAKTDNAETIRMLITGMFAPAELDFKGMIEANLYNNLSLEELAFLAGFSLSSFKREFVKHYDQSPAKYIKQRKLEKAAKLLKATELRISEVAYECGFVDLAHFSKSFQQFYHVSPSNYRLD